MVVFFGKSAIVLGVKGLIHHIHKNISPIQSSPGVLAGEGGRRRRRKKMEKRRSTRKKKVTNGRKRRR